MTAGYSVTRRVRSAARAMARNTSRAGVLMIDYADAVKASLLALHCELRGLTTEPPTGTLMSILSPISIGILYRSCAAHTPGPARSPSAEAGARGGDC